MRRKKLILCLAVLALGSITLVGCDEAERQLPNSTGKSGELLIIVDTAVWNSEVGTALKNCFAGEEPGLPQREPHYSIVRVPPKGRSSVFKTTSKIIAIEIGEVDKPVFVNRNDVWANDQLYIKIAAPSGEEVKRIVDVNCDALLSLLKTAELNKLKKSNAKAANKAVTSELKEHFGVQLDVPVGFERVVKDTAYVYYRRDSKVGEHSIIQGVVVYTSPYTSTSQFTVNQMVSRRNSITKEAVKGSKNDIYMEVYSGYPQDSLVFEQAGCYAKEIRGLWRMNGQFMGGPFVNYAVVDTVQNRVVHIDGFVYAPKFNKRDYVREVEAIARSLKLEDRP